MSLLVGNGLHGRALLLGEVVDSRGRRRDLHLKGTGPHAGDGGPSKPSWTGTYCAVGLEQTVTHFAATDAVLQSAPLGAPNNHANGDHKIDIRSRNPA